MGNSRWNLMLRLNYFFNSINIICYDFLNSQICIEVGTVLRVGYVLQLYKLSWPHPFHALVSFDYFPDFANSFQLHILFLRKYMLIFLMESNTLICKHKRFKAPIVIYAQLFCSWGWFGRGGEGICYVPDSDLKGVLFCGQWIWLNPSFYFTSLFSLSPFYDQI